MNIHAFKSLITEILRDYPETRDSRAMLFVRMCERRGLNLRLILPPEKLRMLMDNIELFVEKDADRRRREIQNDLGLYRPTSETVRQRLFFAAGGHLKDDSRRAENKV